jgi:ATP-dependent helicase/nuclease subunit B
MRFVHPDLEKLIDSRATVVTPSPLLAAVIQKQYGSLQLARHRKSWQQPAVLSLSAWFQQTWALARRRVGKRVPALLTPAQERLLWQRVIQRSEAEVLDTAATARAAASAVRTVVEWQISFDDPAWSEHDDALALRRWAWNARVLCEEQSWILGTDSWTRMADWMDSQVSRNPIVFAGFGTPVPALRSLASNLKNIGFEVEFAEPVRLQSEIACIRCESVEDEFELAARWARARLEETPAASLAILIPNLTGKLGPVKRAFAGVFRPASALEPVSLKKASEASIFHIHCGERLREFPVIAAGLALLDLALPQIPMASISLALNSPYIGGSRKESSNRALADARLRRLREVELTLSAVEWATRDCAFLAKTWPKLRCILKGMPEGSAEASEWSRFITELLSAVGWPGDDDLTTLEQDAIEQWQQVLSAFASLGFVQQEFTWEEALYHLRLLAAADGPTSGDSFSPIQILEPGGAWPFRFDQAWVLGAGEADWPPAEFPSSFIPLSLQRAAELPTATPAVRRESALAFTADMRRIANTLYLSFSATTAATPSVLSPLFLDVKECNRGDLHVWNGKLVLQQIVPVKLEEIEDAQGPPVLKDAPVAGGTHLLKSQSACPFQAFARWRLLADSVDEAVFSFDQRDRGSFLHEALALVWDEIVTLERLRSLPDSELLAIVKHSAEAALSSDKVATPFREQLRMAEAERLTHVIRRWLEVEMKRETDFKVLTTEKTTDVQISRLPMRLRADRIDQLDNGKLVIIDYKSGRPKQGDLDGPRPNEPQLLVYAATLGADVDGLYFAKLRPREEAAIGYGRQAHFGNECEVPDREWGAQLQEWSRTVHKLARDFETGYAPVDPRKDACTYCEMKPICRIAEGRKDQLEDTDA